MRLLCAISGALVLAGCIPDIYSRGPEVPGVEVGTPHRVVSNPESGSDVLIAAGGIVTLELKSNATTGYRWVLVTSLPEDKLVLLRHDYIGDPAPDGMVGVGGRDVFEFSALAAGSVPIVLSYQRHPDDVAQDLTLNVEIYE